MEHWESGQRLHIDRHCKNFANKSQVFYIDTAEIKTWEMPSLPLCPRCVSDENANYLNGLLQNSSNAVDTTDKIKTLYNQLKNDGYELDDEKTFREDLKNDASFRKLIYDTQNNNGYDMGGDFNAWQDRLMNNFNL